MEILQNSRSFRLPRSSPRSNVRTLSHSSVAFFDFWKKKAQKKGYPPITDLPSLITHIYEPTLVGLTESSLLELCILNVRVRVGDLKSPSWRNHSIKLNDPIESNTRRNWPRFHGVNETDLSNRYPEMSDIDSRSGDRRTVRMNRRAKVWGKGNRGKGRRVKGRNASEEIDDGRRTVADLEARDTFTLPTTVRNNRISQFFWKFSVCN